MKTLYFECRMGAAGDMLMAALLELHPQPAQFIERLNQIGIPGVTISAQKGNKCGLTGTQVSVVVNGEEEISQDVAPGEPHQHEDSLSETHHHPHNHAHSHAEEHSHPHNHSHADHDWAVIQQIIQNLQVSPRVRADIMAVYTLIAEAESAVHGAEVGQIHFHEVGAMDAIADITGVCLLIEELAVDRIIASEINVGSGMVRCAHGILPVPAPATAHLLKGIPFYSGPVQAELCTPTGAALLKHFVTHFGPMPVLYVNQIGVGLGHKDFAAANVLRVFLAEEEQQQPDTILELKCSLDDMTPEALGFAESILFEGGAMEVYQSAISMKKNRLGILLTCLCKPEDRGKMLALLFKHTTTLGIRETICQKHMLHRETYLQQTPFGEVRMKKSSGFGVEKEKPEYEDLARIAAREGLSMSDVLKIVSKKTSAEG